MKYLQGKFQPTASNGILLSKLFWLTVRKNCSSDREKLLKFDAEGWEFGKFHYKNLFEHFLKQVANF